MANEIYELLAFENATSGTGDTGIIDLGQKGIKRLWFDFEMSGGSATFVLVGGLSISPSQNIGTTLASTGVNASSLGSISGDLMKAVTWNPLTRYIKLSFSSNTGTTTVRLYGERV